MERPVRVLHVSFGLGLGGTEKVMQFLASGLDRDRFEPSVFSFADGPRRRQLSASGVQVSIGNDLLRCLERLRPHVVHVHRAGWPEPGLLRPLRLARVPVVVETNVFGRRDPSPQARIIDRHLFVSHFCARRYAAVEGIDTSGPRYGVLYNPVDTDCFERHTPAPPWGQPVFGRVSRADPGKWSRLALDALPLLRQHIPDFIFRVIGGIPEAHEFVRAHGLEGHVQWLDPLESDLELAGFYGSLCLLAHANDTGESFGLTIAEAMAAGLPVVTHPAAGLRDNAQLELVEHGKTGLVAGSAEEYAGAVAHLLTNPEDARAMGQRGRDKARRLFRKQAIVSQVEDIYLELLEAKLGPEAVSGLRRNEGPAC